MVSRLAADDATLEQLREYRSRGSRGRSRGRRLFRTVGVLGRARGADLGSGSLLGAPDQVENDYYRFLNQPRD